MYVIFFNLVYDFIFHVNGLILDDFVHDFFG